MISERLAKSLNHRAPTPEQVVRIERLRVAAIVFGEAIETESSPGQVQYSSRERECALTKLEESLMWAIKGIVLE